MSKVVYPGSFDPFTNGHLDIMLRATRIFEKITIAVLHNTKKKTLLSIEDRVELVKEATSDFPSIEVKPFNGLLVDFCKKNNIQIIIRGLRTVTDYDYEQAIAVTNRSLADIETIFLTADKEHSFTSSSIVKEIAFFGGDISDQVPEVVHRKLKELFSPKT